MKVGSSECKIFPKINFTHFVRFKVLTTVGMKIIVLCSVVDRYWHFREICCLHHQGRRMDLLPWWWRQKVTLKHGYLSTELHSQKIVMLSRLKHLHIPFFFFTTLTESLFSSSSLALWRSWSGLFIYLYIYLLVLSAVQTVQHKMEGWLINNKLEKNWEKAVTA
jgi:hypothetical protein